MITTDKDIDLFVASKIGSFKHIKYNTDPSKNTKKRIENLIEIKTLEKDDTITCMSWSDAGQTEILLGRRNQQIHVYSTQLRSLVKSYTADFGTGDVVGLGCVKKRLLAAVSSGVVKIWGKKEDLVINTGGKLDRMRVCGDEETLFATGGEENDLKIWRIGESEPVFIAKNLPHDFLQLRRPIWVSDLVFLSNEGGRLVGVCSRHSYVRLYDTRAQRRPVCNVEFKGMAATSMASSFDERQVLVGFGRGHLHQVDLRKGVPDKGFKGCAGAVTDIALVKEERLIVSCSLDRYLRIHKYQSKELVYKQYLTSKLSCVLVQSETSTPLKNNPEEEEKVPEIKEEVEDEDDLDQLFDNMETVGERPRKKKNAPEEKTLKKTLKRPSELSPEEDTEEDKEDAIKKLLKNTLKKKHREEKKKRNKRSVFKDN